jgi:hypothetical protein
VSGARVEANDWLGSDSYSLGALKDVLSLTVEARLF